MPSITLDALKVFVFASRDELAWLYSHLVPHYRFSRLFFIDFDGWMYDRAAMYAVDRCSRVESQL